MKLFRDPLALFLDLLFANSDNNVHKCLYFKDYDELLIYWAAILRGSHFISMRIKYEFSKFIDRDQTSSRT
jgi:hypothetical protein